jgi:Predicted metal-binding, possibly nucleic acid-binding protein
LQAKSVVMCSLETLKIDLKGMKTDEMSREFDLNDDFFKSLDGSQLEHGALHVSVSIRKATGFYELHFHTEGTVIVPCDICLDDMEQPIVADNCLIAKLGAETNTEDDDVVTVDENEGILDTAWLIYEFIVLAIPIKHVHAPGKCNSVMTQKLEELSGAVRSGKEEAEEIDPRWSALLKLKK